MQERETNYKDWKGVLENWRQECNQALRRDQNQKREPVESPGTIRLPSLSSVSLSLIGMVILFTQERIIQFCHADINGCRSTHF